VLHRYGCCRYRNNAVATGDSIHTCAALADGTTLLTAVGFPAADKMLPLYTTNYSLPYDTMNDRQQDGAQHQETQWPLDVTVLTVLSSPAGQSTAKMSAIIQLQRINKHSSPPSRFKTDLISC